MTQLARRKSDTNYWTATGVIPRWQLVAVYVLVVGATVVGFISVSHQTNRVNDAVRQIQRQRYYLCQDQNRRHDLTIKRLDELIAATSPPRRKKRAERSRAGTLQLINALAPRRNCAVIARTP